MQVPQVYFEDIAIGQSASFAKTVTEADIVLFAGISGDTNPVHLDAAFAAGTPFKQRIAHGMLSAAFLSTVFGTRLPGPGAIYLSQTLRFKAPVLIGDTVTATVTAMELDPRRKRITFACTCTVAGKTVIEGEAVIMVAARPVEA
ncbi:MaoC family dehydratase [Zavarzinia sp. CC-PAN008]|uniref:MaoC family dehydratase n=1 Tax=Zavarzinia sp. CC-PAN008 TaxID=3243332 RepID=UPI003F744AF8